MVVCVVLLCSNGSSVFYRCGWFDNCFFSVVFVSGMVELVSSVIVVWVNSGCLLEICSVWVSMVFGSVVLVWCRLVMFNFGQVLVVVMLSSERLLFWYLRLVSVVLLQISRCSLLLYILFRLCRMFVSMLCGLGVFCLKWLIRQNSVLGCCRCCVSVVLKLVFVLMFFSLYCVVSEVKQFWLFLLVWNGGCRCSICLLLQCVFVLVSIVVCLGGWFQCVWVSSRVIGYGCSCCR